jgi:hypothetical protein
MSDFHTIHRAMAAEPLTDHEDDRLAAKAIEMCPGWSGLAHFAFFKTALIALTPRNILITGVYYGRDIGMMQLAARRHLNYSPKITGVDLFSGAPCADWPDEKRGMSWLEAGFGPHPQLDRTVAHLRALNAYDHVRLVQSNSIEHMSTTEERYDLIYLDTSHDYETLNKEIDAAKLCASSADIVIAGDDYMRRPNWGVVECVNARFDRFAVYKSCIWVSSLSCLK